MNVSVHLFVKIKINMNGSKIMGIFSVFYAEGCDLLLWKSALINPLNSLNCYERNSSVPFHLSRSYLKMKYVPPPPHAPFAVLFPRTYELMVPGWPAA